ncbi:MAG: NAD-dependent epimerase/dehydratase family protein [Cellulosilyticaceae bacterium]
MKILVLGGTRFFGKRAVEEMLVKGYDVTIATRGLAQDDFGQKVRRIIVDRTSAEDLKQKLEGQAYDVVFDNICFTSTDVKNLMDAMEGRIGRYIVTSSLAVYESGLGQGEEAFDPNGYPIYYPQKGEVGYAEGKRLVEAACYQVYKHIPTVAVRFPVVIGAHDYTRRLHFYSEHIKEGKAFAAIGWDEPMSFITEDEAAHFLVALVTSVFEGPINAASEGEITVQHIITMIEEAVGKKAYIDNECEDKGSYSSFGNISLDITQGKKLYKYFVDAEKAFQEVISQIL